MSGITFLLCLLASAAFLNRHKVWFPYTVTSRLGSIRQESNHAYIAPTHHAELSGQDGPSSGQVLENGVPLVGPTDSLHDDIRKLGRGRFSFWGNDVYFSSSDNSSPLENGRSYEIRHPFFVGRESAFALYLAAFFFTVVTTWLGGFDKKTKAFCRSMLSSYVGWFVYSFFSLAGIFCVLLGGAFLSRHGFPRMQWMGDMISGIRPSLAYGKSYVGRAMYVTGFLLGLVTLGLAFLRLNAVEIPEHLEELASFGAVALRRCIGILAVLVLAFVGWGILFRTRPPPLPPHELESIIVDEQLYRARNISQTDVIVVGDSSGLMGVDAPLLGKQLGGMSVENLSTLGWVGPKGYTHLIDMYFRRGLHAKAIVLLMHGMSLNRPEKEWDKWQQMALAESIHESLPTNPYTGLRSELSAVVFGYLFAPPMPGAWGQVYGTSFELSAAIRRNRGSIYQPLVEMPQETGRWEMSARDTGPEGSPPSMSAFDFQLSPSAEAGLREFAQFASGLPANHVFFGITPTYLSYKTPRTIVEEREAANEVANIMTKHLGTRFELLNIVPFRFEEYFASNTHLNRLGREHFTQELAVLLEPTLGL